MKVQTTLSEFIRCDRDFSKYDEGGFIVGRKDVIKFLHFQAYITQFGIRITTGYTYSNDSVGSWSSCNNFEFKKGVLPISEILAWEQDLWEGIFEGVGQESMPQHLIDTLDSFINKSQRIFAMYKEGTL